MNQTKQLRVQSELVGFNTPKEMISVLMCMVPSLAEPENKELSMDYSEKLKTLLAEFEGEGCPTRKNIEEVKSISKWYWEFLATPTEMVAPPGARTFSEEEDPAHGDTGVKFKSGLSVTSSWK